MAVANLSPPPLDTEVQEHGGSKKFAWAWVMWINELFAYVKNLTLEGLNWGSIGGTLANQTDLQSALTAKAVAGATGSSGLTMSTSRLLGRTSSNAGAVEEIAVGSGLQLLAGILASDTSGVSAPDVAYVIAGESGEDGERGPPGIQGLPGRDATPIFMFSETDYSEPVFTIPPGTADTFSDAEILAFAAANG